MPERLQLRRTCGWRKPEGAVVTSRPTRWGNPFVVRIEPNGADPLGWYVGIHGTRYKASGYFHDRAEAVAAAVKTFERWLRRSDGYGFHGLHDRRAWVLDNLHVLAGRDLLCWCKPGEPCHADILLAVVAEAGGDR